MKKISIVIPIYFEEKVLEVIYSSLKDILSKISYNYEIIFVDDGSGDKSLKV